MSDGIDLSSSYAVVFNTGTVYGVLGVYGPGTTNYYVANSGEIFGYSDGVDVGNATVENSGTIFGDNNGVLVRNVAVVSNSGYIHGELLNGVEMSAGLVVNAGTIASGSASRIAASSIYFTGGPAVQSASSQQVLNEGTLLGASAGVRFSYGGMLTNGLTSANISSIYTGVTSAYGLATIVNLGTISGLLNGGVHVGGGLIDNGADGAASALIKGYAYGIRSIGVPATMPTNVVNDGTISGNVAITLAGGGSVANGGVFHAALLTGTDGVDISGGAGRVVNDGTITATGQGIALQAGGTVVNGDLFGGAKITGLSAIVIAGGLGVVANDGAIVAGGNGVMLNAGGSVINGALDHAALLTSSGGGVVIAGAGDVTNDGTISALGQAVALQGGGSVRNSYAFAGASLRGSNGVAVSGGAGTVANAGTIAGTSYGILLGAGGSVGNAASGQIYATSVGVLSTAGAGAAQTTLINEGTIDVAAGRNFAAANFQQGGTVMNGATGVIRNGGAYGVLIVDVSGFESPGVVNNLGTIAGATAISFLQVSAGYTYATSGTVTNAGVIDGNGGTAIRFGGGAERLIVDPGAQFVGNVIGGSGANTLELAAGEAAGSLGGLGSSFTGFGTVAVDPGATWTLIGANSLGTAETVSIASTGTLGVSGALLTAGSLTLAGAGTLAIAAIGGAEVGRKGGATLGRLTVDAANTLTASGTIVAPVIDNGRIAVSGSLEISGSLSGSGMVTIDALSVLDVSGRFAAKSLSFAAGGGATLLLGSLVGASAVISGFGTTDRIDLLGQTVTGATLSGTTLLLSGAHGSLGSLHFRSSYVGHHFAFASDHAGGTNLTLT